MFPSLILGNVYELLNTQKKDSKLGKMRRQSNMFQTKERDITSEKVLIEVEMSNLQGYDYKDAQ